MLAVEDCVLTKFVHNLHTYRFNQMTWIPRQYNFRTPGGVSDFSNANTSPLKKKIDYEHFQKEKTLSLIQSCVVPLQ